MFTERNSKDYNVEIRTTFWFWGVVLVVVGDITSISAEGGAVVVLVVGMVTIAVVTVLFVLLSLLAARRLALVDICMGGCCGGGMAFKLEREVRFAAGRAGIGDGVGAAGAGCGMPPPPPLGMRICTVVLSGCGTGV